MIKLFVTDVDGTLLPYGEKEIASRYLSQLTELLNSGMKLCIASGRSPYNLKYLFAPIADRVTFVCHDGALMVQNDKVLYHRPIPSEEVTRFIRDNRYAGMSLLFAAADRVYILRGNDPLMDFLQDQHADRLCAVSNQYEIRGPIYKMAAFSALTKPPVYNPLPAGIRVCSHAGSWVEYVNRYANKGTALSDLQMRLYLAKYDTAAMGDGRNDLELFRGAKFTCAMPGAPEELKAIASLTAEPDFFLDELLKNNTIPTKIG